MRILIFAPNGGVSLSTGGGVNLVLKQAEALAGLGHHVTLAGFHALPREELERTHAIALPTAVQILPGTVTTAYNALRAVPLKLSAYNAMFDPRFVRWVEGVLDRERPDAVWFHDDIPQVVLRRRPRTRFYLYVHYPLAGRDPRTCPALTRSTAEAANDAVLHALSPLSVVAHPFEVCEGVWTNSTVTARVVERIWGRPGNYLPTYVTESGDGHEGGPRERTIVAVGAFSPGKNYTTLVEGFARARLPGWRLQIAGHERDRRYVARLRALVARRGAERSVELHLSPGRDELRQMVAHADLAVQAAQFEPFGLALLEAMAEGLGPIAYRGPFSGSWLDILREGEFGRGFESVEELAGCFEELASDRAKVEKLKAQGRDRARAFDKGAFVQRFEEIHGVGPGAAVA